MIPTEEQCLALQQEYNMLYAIRTHTAQVAQIAKYIGRNLNNNGYNFNLELIQSSGYLHDITKTHQMLYEAMFIINDKWFDDNVSQIAGKFIDIYNQLEEIKKLGIKENERHAYSGAVLLRHLGYAEVADIIEIHDDPLIEISERGILCYSDRITGKEIVPLNRKFNYIRNKYGQKIVDKLLEPTKQLESLILSAAKLKFKDLLKNS